MNLRRDRMGWDGKGRWMEGSTGQARIVKPGVERRWPD